MTFQIGDKVIYPNHGLGIIERIEEKTILGTSRIVAMSFCEPRSCIGRLSS